MGNPWFETRDECPACASSNFRKIYETPYNEPPLTNYLVDFYSPQGGVEFEYLDGVSFVLCECTVCRTVFQRHIPNDALMSRLYENWIDHHKVCEQHGEQGSLDYYARHAQEIMQVISHFKRLPSTLHFFDYGMGLGKWALMAKAFGCESYGSELSRECKELAASSGIKVVEWDEIPRHRFDFINTEQVFEHIPRPLETLRHLRAALKAGGILKISVPPGNDIDRRLRKMNWKSPKGSRHSLNPVAPLEHINCFRRSSISRMAQEAQMEEVEIPMIHQYRYTIGWAGAKEIAKNALRPLARNLSDRENYVFLRNIEDTG